MRGIREKKKEKHGDGHRLPRISFVGRAKRLKEKDRNARRRERKREKRERVSTSFQTYLRSVKYTVKNIRF